MDAAYPLRTLKSGPLRDKVIDALREAIFAGDLAPGTPLRAHLIAAKLGVSQGTVREALLHLEWQGLAIRDDAGSILVIQLTGRQFQQRIRLRSVLEQIALAEAAARMTEEQMAPLEAILARLQQAILDNLYYECTQTDLEFHRAFWRLTDNEVLYRLLDQVVTPMMSYASLLRKKAGEKLSATVLTQTSHQGFIEALRTGDAKVIEEAVMSHAENYNTLYEWGVRHGFLLASGE
jgi:DNA-binding GntR family transcriptional regulator